MGWSRRTMLTTPQEVIQRAGVLMRPEYEDVSLITDAPGFYAYRPYPAGGELAQIVTNDGRPAVRCYLAFILLAPTEGSHVRRVVLKARLWRRWWTEGVFSSSGDAYPFEPRQLDAPTQQSAAILARTRKPINLDETDVAGLIYDNREDVFIDGDGRKVTPLQMLEEIYTKHCRTLGLGFRIRWNIGSGARWTIRKAVWKGQDAAMWALFTFYDVELIDEKKEKRLDFFYKYKPRDFRRVTDSPNERSHFFGFQSSHKSLFTNLAVLMAVCVSVYYKAPRGGLLRAIYNNPALTTAALVFGFLIADTLGSRVLILTICALSRLRDAVLFFIRKVRV
jgi:hypothetical protein